MGNKVAILGLGYVGLTMAACLAERGVDTVGVDVDKSKIELVSEGKSPIKEPHLEEMITKAVDIEKLHVLNDYPRVLEDTDMTFITVGTPSRQNGSIDLGQIKLASESIGKALKNIDVYHLVVVRSTVIPGTCERTIKPTIEANSSKSCGKDFGLCMNPEFLQEGSAVQDMLKPDRIVIGEYDNESGKLLEGFYRKLYSDDMPALIRTSLSNAELIKYANNAFLATKISFINSIANLCEKLPKSDVEVIAKGIGLDPRISSLFLKAGLGWGGSCFPKDSKALLTFARKLGVDLSIVDSALKTNESQPLLAVEKARKALGGLKGKHIAILGLAFKPDTDDIRESASIKIIDALLKEEAKISAYDPAAMENVKIIFGEKITFANSAEECFKDTDCCIIVTEWDEFKKISPERFKAMMKRPIVIDGRRIYDVNKFSNRLEYISIGLGKSS